MPGRAAALPLSPIATAGTDDWVHGVAFAPGGDRVAVACADGSVTLLGLDGATRVIARHDAPATSVAFSCDGRLASGGQDGRITIDGAVEQVGEKWVQAMTWRPDGELLAVAHGRTVTIHDGEGAPLAHSSELPATVACLQWHPRGVQLAAGSYGGVTLLRGNGLPHEGRLAWKGSVLEIAIAPDGRRLAHGNQDASVHFWDLRKRTELEMWGYATKVLQLSWRHDSRLLATGGGSEVTIWDFAGRGPEGSRPLTLDGHSKHLSWLGFAPRSRRLASVGGDGLVMLWMPGVSSEPIGVFAIEQPATCAAWSPDGRLLAVGCAQSAVLILDADHPR